MGPRQGVGIGHGVGVEGGQQTRSSCRRLSRLPLPQVYSIGESGRNAAPAHAGRREVQEVFLPVFEKAVRAGAMGAVCADRVSPIALAARHILERRAVAGHSSASSMAHRTRVPQRATACLVSWIALASQRAHTAAVLFLAGAQGAMSSYNEVTPDCIS